MYDLSIQQDAPDDSPATRRKRQSPHEIVKLAPVGECCCRAVYLALSADDVSRIGAAQTRGRFAQRVEHRLQIKGRAADDLQHVAGRRLVFERFFEVVRAAL